MAERLHWPNQFVFILAAIGSAAGLGNLWRFPFLAYDHGGAAFVLVFILASIVVGIPLLLLEVGLGQMTQRGAPDAFGRVKKGLRFLGWLALVFGFMILAYYMAVMAWGIDYLGSAFTLSWQGDTEGYFFNQILNVTDGPGVVGGFAGPVIAGFLLAWAFVYFAAWKGVRSVSKVVVWTATLPFVILAVLLVRALTLEGAMDGIRAFLVPDWSALGNSQLWLDAFSQVFFTLSLAFGIMIGYGSLNHPKTNITNSTIWIVVGNFLVSLLSGLVVFGTLGYMAHTQGVGLADVVAGGPSLAFVTFPEAISLLPALVTLVAVLFFAMFVMLAVDSAFSLFESLAISIRDRFPHVSAEKIALFVAAAGIAAGLIFTTGGGIYYLDIADHFLVNYGLVIVGLLEVIAVGWLWKGDALKDYINGRSRWQLGRAWDVAIKFVIPLFLVILLVWNIYNEFAAPYEGYPLWALLTIGVLPLVLAPIIAALLDKFTGGSRHVEGGGSGPGGQVVEEEFYYHATYER